MEKLDKEQMVSLWRAGLRAETDFERGYYQGRFEEYARQNAINPDEFPMLQAVAKQDYRQARGAVPRTDDELPEDQIKRIRG